VASPAIDVLIVEDQLLLLGVLSETLAAIEGITIAATATTVEKARQTSAFYNVVLTDISLPGENGVQFARECKAKRPDVGVLLLSAHTFPAVLASLQEFAGGWGYLLKDSVTDTTELARAIRIVADGGVMIDGALRANATPNAGSVLDRLSPGQWQLLQAISGGWSNQAISEQLSITPKSVENAVGRLYQQLGIDATDRTRNARVEATRLLLKHGLNVP